MLVVALAPPCTRVRLLGDAARVKLCGTFTATDSVVLADKLPDVPMTVTVALPRAAELDAVRLSVLVPEVAPGLNDAVTPLGRPEAEKETLPLNPPRSMTAMVAVALLPPCTRLRLVGDAVSVKLGAVLTVTEREVVSVRFPEVPVMVAVTVPVAAVLDAIN